MGEVVTALHLRSGDVYRGYCGTSVLATSFLVVVGYSPLLGPLLRMGNVGMVPEATKRVRSFIGR